MVSFFPDWIKRKIVLRTRKIGKSDYYKLNLENSFVKNIIKLDWSLVKKSAMPELEEKELLL
mgnify:CR=1 FL=1